MYVAGAQENALFAASTLGEAISAPTQTQEVIYVTGAQENAPFAAFTMAETRLRARRYVRPEPKTKEGQPNIVSSHHEMQWRRYTKLIRLRFPTSE